MEYMVFLDEFVQVWIQIWTIFLKRHFFLPVSCSIVHAKFKVLLWGFKNGGLLWGLLLLLLWGWLIHEIFIFGRSHTEKKKLEIFNHPDNTKMFRRVFLCIIPKWWFFMEIFIFGFMEILFVVYWIFGHNIIWIFGFVTILRLWWWRLLLVYWNWIIWIQFCAVISICSIGTIWRVPIYTVGFFGWIIWMVWFLVIY